MGLKAGALSPSPQPYHHLPQPSRHSGSPVSDRRTRSSLTAGTVATQPTLCAGSGLPLHLVGLVMGAGAVVLVQEVLSPAAQWCSRDNMKGCLWPGEPPAAWLGPVCCEPELSPVNGEGSCLPAKEQGPILECHWRVLSTVGPGRDLVGKPPGKEELLQEVVELSAVCQQGCGLPSPPWILHGSRAGSYTGSEITQVS